jgi:hypothetical protein
VLQFENSVDNETLNITLFINIMSSIYLLSGSLFNIYKTLIKL